MNTMISIQGLHKYFGKIQAVKNVDLDIARGEVLVIVGRRARAKVQSSVASIISRFPPPARSQSMAIWSDPTTSTSTGSGPRLEWSFNSSTCSPT